MTTTNPIQTIRIEKIKLENVKGVLNGEIEFNCLKNPSDKEIQADILGLYGQNGSGKTTLLEALQIVRLAMLGKRISYSKYNGIIAQGADYARITVQFQVRNPDDTFYHLEYAFSLGAVTISNEKSANTSKSRPTTTGAIVSSSLAEAIGVVTTGTVLSSIVPVVTASAGILARLNPLVTTASVAGIAATKIIKSLNSTRSTSGIKESVDQMIIFDEVLNLSGVFKESVLRWGPVFDASATETAFLPKSKHKAFFPIKTGATLKEIQKYKEYALLDSRSFIFSDEISRILLTEQENQSEYAELIFNLKAFAIQSFRVLDSRSSYINGEDKIILYTARRAVSISKRDSTTLLDDEGLNTLQIALKGLNTILKQLIPGLSIEAVRQVDIDLERNERVHSAGTKVAIYSVRDNVRIPIAGESTGILHLISALGLISYAFANEGVTVAIDEIDAGVYEYLLGELLLVFEESGCGQLIFTCHNLRPLELLDKKFIYFTTTNSENRYLKPKNIRYENNLRDVYIREIIAGGQEEELYSASKHGKIAAALQKAGEIIGKE